MTTKTIKSLAEKLDPNAIKQWRGVLERFNAVDAKLQETRELRVELQKDIETMESEGFDPLDDDAVESLTKKRTSLELCGPRIEKLEEEWTRLRGQLYQVLNEIDLVLNPIMGAEVNAETEAKAAELRNLFPDSTNKELREKAQSVGVDSPISNQRRQYRFASEAWNKVQLGLAMLDNVAAHGSILPKS